MSLPFGDSAVRDRRWNDPQRPRLAYVANSKIPSRQANTTHVLNMSAAFAEAGAAVTLIARGDQRDAVKVFDDFALPTRFGIRLQPFLVPWALDRLMFVRHVRRALARNPIDFVYGRSCYGLLGGVPRGVPFAYDVHAFPETRRHRQLEERLFRRANLAFVTAISRALAERYADAYPSLRGRIRLAPCAARIPECSALGLGAREDGPLRVYYVGHLYPGRGVDLIVELARLEPQIEFHIVGGEDADIAAWSARTPPNLRLHGYVRPSDLPAHYRRADVCIAPHARKVAAAGGGDISAWMSPMKLFEYMANAKAIVAADLPAIREIIASETDGLLCPPDDVGSWRSALRKLRDDTVLRERLGRAARDRAVACFSWEHRARSILQFAAEFHEPARTVPGLA